uniref:C-type lectin domain-containing protein n=1 Tax=Lates calcarifer TaxID=8187 RepID=A0A4W6G674_LATCA
MSNKLTVQMETLTLYYTLLMLMGQMSHFVFINNFMTWTEAQSYSNHTDLASVRNMEENQKIMELLPSRQDIWIGLFRDSWKWSDGSNSSFRYWITGEPNGPKENCAVADFSSSGKWVDVICDHRTAFICYSGKS